LRLYKIKEVLNNRKKNKNKIKENVAALLRVLFVSCSKGQMSVQRAGVEAVCQSSMKLRDNVTIFYFTASDLSSKQGGENQP